MKENELIELMLPEGLLTYFEIAEVENSDESCVFHLAEKNIPSEPHKKNMLKSKSLTLALIIHKTKKATF